MSHAFDPLLHKKNYQEFLGEASQNNKVIRMDNLCRLIDYFVFSRKSEFYLPIENFPSETEELAIALQKYTAGQIFSHCGTIKFTKIEKSPIAILCPTGAPRYLEEKGKIICKISPDFGYPMELKPEKGKGLILHIRGREINSQVLNYVYPGLESIFRAIDQVMKVEKNYSFSSTDFKNLSEAVGNFYSDESNLERKIRASFARWYFDETCEAGFESSLFYGFLSSKHSKLLNDLISKIHSKKNIKK